MYWTPSTLLAGEYSIDDGPWVKTDVYKPINDHFHRIVFKGKLVTRTTFVNELDISRIVSGITALIYMLFVLAALILQFTIDFDLIDAQPWFNILMGLIIPVHVFLLMREARIDRRALRYLLSWIPLLVSVFIDVWDLFFPFPGNDHFIYGFGATIAVQIIQLVFDLQRQYKQSVHYYQIQKELYEARLSIMTSQIRPHFMYNALTSIAMMCTIDPPTAQEATITFAKYLRENMDSTVS